MIKFIRRKIFYHQIKKAIFEAFEHGDEWINLITKLAVACKDMTPDDVKKEFISALAEKIHSNNQKTKKTEKE